jgi:hypothetical protein
VEGSGWWNGQVSSCDGRDYTVLYENGQSEVYDSTEMSQIVALPEMEKVGVGSRVDVLWSDDEEYYRATVTGKERNKKRSLSILYDSGESEWVDLRRRKFRLVEEGVRSCAGQEYPNGTKVKKVCGRGRLRYVRRSRNFSHTIISFL